MNRKFTWVCCLIALTLLWACGSQESTDKYPPYFMSSTPEDGASSVDVKTVITVKYTDNIVLSPSAVITLNGQSVTASVDARTLTINASLQAGTSYTLSIPANAISDVDGNFASSVQLKFTTAAVSNGTDYEAENATLSGDAAIAKSISGYSGTGYVNTNSGNVTFSFTVENAGYYDVTFRYSTSGSAKQNDLYLDNVKMASLNFDAVTTWTDLKTGKLKLKAGSHTVSIVKNWGWMQLDKMTISYSGASLDPFNIVAQPVTPNPSTQLSNVYNFLKTNFGTKIISGTMAAHSTNINEATWVYNNTGKWPALTCFDFIDHTYPNQNWVSYSGPITLGQNWWNNNGLVALMWHWRDPLTKSGSFYTYSSSNTTGTTFDVSKISDTSSAEYKAMVADIDVIAAYLKEFKNANIPVIWRPLHEASGGWFWWGAKGAEPCKALWRLMFDRLVNYHGLNNLIWVWTSDASDSATSWYPGDSYVDVIGMDIYPGENQHGSQYLSFNKIKELFGGKKIVTLSECGSAPDPALMMEYGDTWSWFMPWNGDYTESASHNGVSWWQKFFSYDYVITRDKMPSLK